MKINNPLKLIISLILSLSAGSIGSFFTMSSVNTWYVKLAKPVLNPPNWVFGPVWTLLYILIGVSLFLVWKNNWFISNHILEKKKDFWNRWSERLWIGDLTKVNILSIFFIQFVLNIFWSFAFFGLQSPLLAFYVILALLVSIIYMIINFYRVSKVAAYILLPYLLWVGFAAYLNFSIFILN